MGMLKDLEEPGGGSQSGSVTKLNADEGEDD